MSGKRKPLKHLEVPENLGVGEGGRTLPKLYDYFQQVDEYIDELLSGGGQPGDKGDPGKSAYEVAVEEGFEGSVGEWLESLRGKDGDKGDPFSYDDFTEEQLNDLRGKDGKDGEDGDDGFGTEAQYNDIISRLEALEGSEEGDD